jgi:hypothetical protein
LFKTLRLLANIFLKSVRWPPCRRAVRREAAEDGPTQVLTGGRHEDETLARATMDGDLVDRYCAHRRNARALWSVPRAQRGLRL